MKKLLVLGGSQEARELTERVIQIPHLEVIVSLAGRTCQPSIKGAKIVTGGFGGVNGLIAYLQREKIDFVVDATHPFATQISQQVKIATSRLNIPQVTLTRGDWSPTTGDNWYEVDNYQRAAEIIPELGKKRIFLTIGRQQLTEFAHLSSFWFLMRMIETPTNPTKLPPGEILLQRGPFTVVEERSLLEKHQIELIVSKNSGGKSTVAKVIAARQLKLPIVMIKRPQQGEHLSQVESVIAWLESQ